MKTDSIGKHYSKCFDYCLCSKALRSTTNKIDLLYRDNSTMISIKDIINMQIKNMTNSNERLNTIKVLFLAPELL